MTVDADCVLDTFLRLLPTKVRIIAVSGIAVWLHQGRLGSLPSRLFSRTYLVHPCFLAQLHQPRIDLFHQLGHYLDNGVTAPPAAGRGMRRVLLRGSTSGLSGETGAAPRPGAAPIVRPVTDVDPLNFLLLEPS